MRSRGVREPGARRGAVAGVAAQTPEQTFRTLLISVVLLFCIAVTSYYFYQRATYYGSRVASYMESKLIVDTFGHVLRLPLSFFNHQASAGLARRIDQCDQVAPVVHAVSQQIAPEAVRLVAICAIMMTQNWEMSLVAICLLPPYMWLARRAALRLRVEPGSLLPDVGRHFGADRGRHRRGENGETLRAPKLAKKRSCARNRSAPTTSICAGSRRRRNTISRRSPSAI